CAAWLLRRGGLVSPSSPRLLRLSAPPGSSEHRSDNFGPPRGSHDESGKEHTRREIRRDKADETWHRAPYRPRSAPSRRFGTHSNSSTRPTASWAGRRLRRRVERPDIACSHRFCARPFALLRSENGGLWQ